MAYTIQVWQLRGYDESEAVIVLLSCLNIHPFSASSFWREVLSLLKDKLESAPALQSEIDTLLGTEEATMQSLRRALGKIGKQNKFLVLLVDDYDAALRSNKQYDEAEIEAFLSECRSLACHSQVFVPFDLQDKSQLPIGVILHSLATEIIAHLDLEPNKITLPSVAELETDTDIFSRDLLPKIFQELNNKNLVLLLDEFDVLSDYNPDSAVEHFFPYLKSLIEQQEKLFVIPVVGRRLDDMPKLLELFKGAPYLEIGLLDEFSAKRLITNPAKGVLEYEDDAIRAILGLSAGNPYFTQIICFAIFGRAREKQNGKVTRADVESVVDKAIEIGEAGLSWFRDGLPIPERVVFSAVAEAQESGYSSLNFVAGEPLTLLTKNGVVQTEALAQAGERLYERGFLEKAGYSESLGVRVPMYKVKVELVRRWFVKRHSLQRELWQLENLDSEALDIYKVATKRHERGDRLNALKLYEQVLVFNPNHFSALFNLAQGYLDAKDFSKAVELYTRAYQVDAARNREGLVRSLSSYGDELIAKRELKLAKAQFERVLEIEPDNTLALKRLRQIKALEDEEENKHPTNAVQTTPFPNPKYKDKYKRTQVLLGGVAAIVSITAALVGVGFGFYFGLNSCREIETNGICQFVSKEPQRFSSGERTLFPGIKNYKRDSGIKAFRKGNYSKAAKFFKKAVEANPRDPEVLIYYNNALARQQGSPVTLAVVVSADNGVESTQEAQETLQGVAQAQNQFNESKGFKGRLLEIVIANDSNRPEKSKQVAQELVKNKSVLGVMGHDTSDSSKAALTEYEKAGLAMVTYSSASTWLTGNVFFRTVPSNAESGKRLAEYVRKKGVAE